MKKTILLGILLPLAFWQPAKAQTWDQVIKKVASDRAAEDYFGLSIAIDGDYAIISSLTEDEDENGNNTAADAGSAYIFEKDINGNWNQVQKIVASDRASGDQFGNVVSISGNYAIVGAQFEDEDENGSNTANIAGSAYVFERDGSGDWNEVQKIVASDRTTGDRFGYSVSISGDYIIIGAYNESEDENGANTASYAGSAYIFERDGSGDWNEVQKIVASDRATGDHFGASVAISGDYVIVGAPNEDEDENGNNTLSNAGSAYIFERDGGGNWNEVQKNVASDRDVDDRFAGLVSISENYIIVSSIFEDEDENGSNTLTDAGSAYIFERDGSGDWNEVQKIVASDRATNDNFGRGAAISGDYIIIGSFNEDEDENGSNTFSGAGSAYIFERDGNGDWNEIQKIVASDRAIGDHFGYSVGISGASVISGAFSEKEDENGSNTLSNAGSAYIFELKCNEITAQPSNDEICNGDNTSFSVTATGTSLTYQWQEDSGSGFGNISNGGVYSGATTATLTITGATTSMDGNEYRCVVSSTCGTDTYSDEVVLTVNPATLSAGPGGVGSVDDNELWLDASTLSYSNGASVSTWYDKSGNSNDATQATSGNRPLFRTNAVNSLAAVDFDGGNDHLITGTISGLETNNLSWIVVAYAESYSNGTLISTGYSSGASTSSGQLWKTYISASNYHSLTRRSDGVVPGDVNHGTSSSYTILTDVWDGGSAKNRGYTDEALSGTQSTVNASPSGHIKTVLGARSDATTTFYNGRIAEAIIYSKTLNDAERIIVDNYLATKYNITLSGNDIYAYDTTHSFEAAGIGQDTNSTNHTSSKGGIVEMSNASSLDNGDYLMWAHDNGSLTPTTTDVPSAYTSTSGERLPREWRVDKTNDVGTVTVAFYLDGIAIDDDLELLVDSDGTFSDATRITSGYTYDEACSIARWTGISFSDGDYFTVGSPDGSSLLVTPIFESENLIEDEFNLENTLEVVNSITEQVEIKMYPNPTNGILTIENKIDNSSINVYNMFGQKVYSGSLNNGKNKIDFSELANGVYIIELNDFYMNKILSTQFVLMK